MFLTLHYSQIITLGKKYKTIFYGKKMMPKLVVFYSRKKLHVLKKKIFFQKKNPSSLYLQIRPKKLCAGII